MNPPDALAVALALAVGASVLFAFGTTLQHTSVGARLAEDQGSRSIGPRRLLKLLRTPRWLAGLGLILVGAAMHIFALTKAPVTVVQPVGILAVVWSVLLAAKLHGYQITRQIWTAVALTVGGIVAFTILSTWQTSNDTVIDAGAIFTACAAVFVISGAVAFFARRGPSWLRCLGWASAGAILYGLSSGQLKTLTELITRPDFLTDTLFWGCIATLLPTYLIGGWFIQQAFAAGPAEIVVGGMTTIDPLVAVLFGILVLGEGATLTVPAAIGMVLAAAVATGGVVLLSKHHPDVENRQLLQRAEQRAEAQA